jgi:hypothetical protein
MERKKIIFILNNIKSIYIQLRNYISDYFNSFKEINNNIKNIVDINDKNYFKNENLTNLNLKIQNNFNNYLKIKENIFNTIKEINNNLFELEKNIETSNFFLKNNKSTKFILDVPIYIKKIISYINILENDINNNDVDNIEFLYTLINNIIIKKMNLIEI